MTFVEICSAGTTPSNYHSGIGLLTPESVHYGRAATIVEGRKQVLLDFFGAPDPMLGGYETDYRWTVQVYESVKPVSSTGQLLWHRLGAKTIELIHENVHVEAVQDEIASHSRAK